MLFFHGEAVNIGLLGKLAMKLHVFAKQEDEGPKLKKQKHKAQLDERKLDIKLLAAQKKEQEARVSEETGGLLFEANVAKAELKLNARDDELEAKFRKEGVADDDQTRYPGRGGRGPRVPLSPKVVARYC